MTIQHAGRRVVSTRTTPFEPYDLDGPLQPEMALLPLSYDRRTQSGTYLMRMEPGAETIQHTHRNLEEFMVLEGQLIDDDGTVFNPGDCVCFDPGTRHNSRTDNGCLLIVFEWRRDA